MVVNQPFARSFKLRVQKGVAENGNPKYSIMGYSQVKIDANLADVYATAQAIADLQQFPLLAVYDEVNGELVNQ